MKKKTILWLLASFVIMFLIPGLTVIFVPGEAAFAVLLTMLVGVDPLYATVLGVASGLDLRRMWYQPIVCAGLFVAGTWIFLEWGEPAFVQYGAGYLLIGVSFMLICAGITAMNNRNRQERL